MNDVKETFQEAQGRHLRVLEKWGAKGRKVAGVPVVQMLNYDLVQMVNQVYLSEYLQGQEAQPEA